MRRLFSKTPRAFCALQNNKGQSFVLVALLTVVLLALSGLAADAAKVSLRNLQAQNSADAGALAAINRLSQGAAPASAQQTATDIARYNLREAGIPEGDIVSITPLVNIDANNVMTVEMNVELNVETFFLKIAPFSVVHQFKTPARAVSTLNPAAIAVLLDTSSSMFGQKIEDLKDAAERFVEQFQPNMDQMAIITFDTRASVRRQMGTFNDHDELKFIIQGLFSAGATNMSEAIEYAWRELEGVTDDSYRKFVVLFTDGVPTIIRVDFLNRDDTPQLIAGPLGNGAGGTVDRATLEAYEADPTLIPPLPENPEGSGVYDYYAYWGLWLFRWDGGDGLGNGGILNFAECGGIPNCLENYEYLDSKGNLGGEGVDDLTEPWTGNQAMWEDAYNLNVKEMDYVKDDQQAVVYTIGLGDPADPSADPYQNVFDIRIKNTFLMRLANDPRTAENPEFPGLPNNVSHPRGLYLQTPHSDELVGIFHTVAKDIKIRLIE